MKTNNNTGRARRGSTCGKTLAVTLLLSPWAVAASYSWTGDHDSNWSDSRNWAPSGVPGVNDDVTITDGNVNAGGSRTVKTFSLHNSTVSNMDTLTATTATLNGTSHLTVATANLAHLNTTGGTIQSATINLTSSSTWTGLTIRNSSLNLAEGASVNLPSGVSDFFHTTFNNQGTVTMSGGQLRGYETAVIENHGTWSLQNTETPFTSLYGGNIFNNHGVLQKNGTAPVTNLGNSWTFNLMGQTRANSGILNLATTTNLPNGAELTGPGTIDIVGNTHLSGVVTETVSSLRLNSGGQLICSETAAFNGTLDWLDGTISGTFHIAGGSQLEVKGPEIHRLNILAGIENHGVLRWHGSGPINAYERNTIHNHADGTIDIAADGTPFTILYGGSQLENDGTVIKSAGSETATFKSLAFRNNGSLVSNSGTIELQPLTELTDGSTLSGSSSILFNGDVRLSGTVTETVNSLWMIGETLTGTAPCSLVGSLDYEAGTLAGAIGIPHGSLLNITGEEFKRLNINSRLDVHGELRWTGPRPLQFYENSVVQIHPDGVCNLSNDGDPFDSVYGGNELIIEGTFQKSNGSGGTTVCDSPTIRHKGDILCNTSTLEFTNTLYFEDSSTISGTGQVNLNGTMHLPGTVEFTAPTTWIGGSITGTGGSINGLLEWTGGISYGDCVIGSSGRLVVSDGTGAEKRLHVLATLEVSGALELSSGTLIAYERTLIKINSGGRCEGTGTALISITYGGNVLEVAPGGLLTTTSSGDLQINNQLVNHGLVSIPAGTLACHGGGGPSTGTYQATSGGTLLFTGGIHELDTDSTITGSGDIRVTGGTLRAIAPVNAIAHLDGGTIEGQLPDGEFRFLDGSSWSNGYLGGQSVIPNGATLHVDGSDPELRRLNLGAALDIQGKLKLNGNGHIQAYEKCLVEIDASGTLELTDDGSPFQIVYGGSSLTNHGTILKSGGDGDSLLQSIPYFSDGTINCQSGRIAINGPFSFWDGNTITGPGNTALIGGTTTLAGTTTVDSSVLELAGAELLGVAESMASLTGQSIEWSSGTVSGVVSFNGAASTTTDGFRRINLNGELRNAGTLTLNGSGVVQCYENSTLRNLPTGTLNTPGAVSISRVYGGNLFINEGTLTIGSPTGTLTVAPPFQQTSTGRLVVGVAGNSPDFDRLVVNNTATLAGTVVANLEGGFSPPVDTSFEVVDANTRVGTFDQAIAARFDVTYPVIGAPPVSQQNVVLVVKAGNSLDYDSWAEEHSLSGDDALPGADPDNDGVDNFTEYALNMNPNTIDQLPLGQSVADFEGVPCLVLHYRVWENRIGAGLRYLPETSTDMIDWHQNGMIDELDPSPPVIAGSEARMCRIPLNSSKQFLHLRFTNLSL
ncbi:MAG: hypothetical protein ACSHYF_08195 [Verrucomicrobiaceae bacterium]